MFSIFHGTVSIIWLSNVKGPFFLRAYKHTSEQNIYFLFNYDYDFPGEVLFSSVKHRSRGPYLNMVLIILITTVLSLHKMYGFEIIKLPGL